MEEIDSEKYNSQRLAQLQSLPLEAKIMLTRKRVLEFYNHYDGQCYISFSGGKDSTVLKHLIENYVGLKIPCVFINTGLEYPEVRKFAISQPNVEVIRPKLTFRQVIEKYGYPVISKEQSDYIYQFRHAKSEKTKNLRLHGDSGKSYKISEKWKFLINAPFEISSECCKYMKKNPAKNYEKKHNVHPIVATMTEESILRYNQWIRHGCNAFNTSRPISKPISVWTEQDILQYIVKNNVKIAEIYGEIKEDENGKLYTSGVKRTGCMFCMYGIQNECRPNRFDKMKESHPKQYEYCMNSLGIRKVLDFIGIHDLYEDW